ncbi:bifunctional nuclease family protein [Dietzia sp.]|uniref:bifunctional nuclease family protein n=1 Tax=Dietzia sp. TaxID=1871616 RepID=UPI002FD9A6B0
MAEENSGANPAGADIELRIVGVRFEEPDYAPVLILREVAGNRVIPVWIGAAEAASISMQQQGVVPDRPLSHDLHVELISALGHSLDRVVLTRVDRGTFYAELLVDGTTTISARPSDAVAIALRAAVPVFARPGVLEEVGINLDAEGEVDVEAFKEFLDHVSPEDFLDD